MAAEENPEIGARVESYHQFTDELLVANTVVHAYEALSETETFHPATRINLLESLKQAVAHRQELIDANPDHAKRAQEEERKRAKREMRTRADQDYSGHMNTPGGM